MNTETNASIRWREIKGTLYVDIKDVQLALRATKCDSEIANIALRCFADVLREFEDKTMQVR